MKNFQNNFVKQYRVHSMKNLQNSKRFHWNIITMCNYKCSYCYSRAMKNQWNKISSKKIIDEVISELKQIKGNKELFLLGGEPTMHPNYFYILDELYDELDIIGNITNGSYKNYDKMVTDHLKYKDKFFWNITYHPTQTADEIFKKTILFIKQNGFKMNVNFLLDINHKERINKLLLFCVDNNINFYPSFLFSGNEFNEFNDFEWINFINENFKPVKELYYIDDKDNIFNYNDLDTFKLGLTSFKGWECLNESFVIPVNENKFKQFCTMDEFTSSMINRDNCKVICKLDTCICPARGGDEKSRIVS